MKKIRVFIVDDERHARVELRRLIAGVASLELVGEASNADEAEKLIAILQPEVIFLDIQMPGRSGFELLEDLKIPPEIIFTTAYDQYAVKAFEISALDYLLKPIRTERFIQAIEKTKLKLATGNASKKVFVKNGDGYLLVNWESVGLIESVENYARIYFEGKNAWIKSSLNQLEKLLDGSSFFRCNRAQLINLNYIDKIGNLANGKLKITLSTGQVVEVSERRSVLFKKTGKM